MIQIDKNVPLPVRPASGGPAAKYPLRTMEVGDSFFVAGATSAKISGSTAQHKPKKYSSRSVTENGVSGVRVWRIA